MKLTKFDFYWVTYLDSPYSYSVKSESADGKTLLKIKADGVECISDIAGKEDEFISDILSCGVSGWNGKKYESSLHFVMDGYFWGFEISYDGGDIMSSGSNGYPEGFDRLLTVLHEKWGVPVSSLDKGIEDQIKNSKIAGQGDKNEQA